MKNDFKGFREQVQSHRSQHDLCLLGIEVDILLDEIESLAEENKRLRELVAVALLADEDI